MVGEDGWMAEGCRNVSVVGSVMIIVLMNRTSSNKHVRAVQYEERTSSTKHELE